MSRNWIVSLWFPHTRWLIGVVLWETRPMDRPFSANIHENGEGLSGDIQLGSQGSVHKALFSPRVDEDPERF